MAAGAGASARGAARGRSPARLSGLAVRSVGRRDRRFEAERKKAEVLADEKARRRRAEEERQARDLRVVALASRGEHAWREVETEAERRNAPGYERAAVLLADLRALAERDGTLPAFEKRLAAIRVRHASKRRFIERLDAIPGLQAQRFRIR